MNFIAQRIERSLWPGPVHGSEGRVPMWLRVLRYTYALVRDLLEGDLSLRAMSLVYNTMLAIVPLLAIAFAVLKGLGFHRDMQPLLMNFFAPLGPRADELTERIIGFVDNVSSSALASLSIVILLYSALSMAQKVESSFNFVWRVDRPRSFARRFSEYLSVMLVGPLLMSVAMGFTATLASTAAVSRLRQAGPIGEWLVSLSSFTPYVMVIAGFTFLYMFVPNTRVHWKAAAIGGVFAGVLWAASGSVFTSFVVSVARTEAIYSGFAIVIVAMIWMHLSWVVLLLGAQLSFYLQNPEYLRLGKRTVPMSNGLRERLALNAMLLVGKDFEQPGHGWRIESLAAAMRIPRNALDPVIAALMSAGLLTRTTESRLVPAKDPHRIRMADVIDSVRATDHDSTPGEWNETVRALGDSIDAAVRNSLGDHTLADMVEADLRRETASAPAEPRAISR